jgi:uncharacterized protein (DUF58 family)
MTEQELLRKIREIKIRIRKRVDSTFAGDYTTAFRGQGLEFEEVRAYQAGDDIRSIDWNVTARSSQAYIKVFREERERNVFVLFDISASQDFGPENENKKFIGCEIAAVLAYSALQQNDKFGLATYTSGTEKYFPAKKGRKHFMALLSALLASGQKSEQTNLKASLDFLRKTLKKRSVLFIISDFIDKGYEESVLRASIKHEIVLIRIFHPSETMKKSIGILPFRNAETKKINWIPAGRAGLGKKLTEGFSGIDLTLRNLAKNPNIHYISISANLPYIPVLEGFFHKKHLQKRHINE